MNKILLLPLLLVTFSLKAQYESQNLSLFSVFDDPSVPAEPNYGIRYNGCWGYVDPLTNKEYGIIGSSAGTYIIDITIPSSPVQVAYFPGRRDSCVWREFKTYKNYLYGISDDSSPNSFQIFDLSGLPIVTKVHDSDSIFERAHTLYIDGDKLYAAGVSTKTKYHTMAVFSLKNPAKPQFLRGLEEDYSSISGVHDMFARNDTVYASCAFQGLYAFKFDTLSNTFIQLGSVTTYPGQGYNHSSALAPNGKTLFFCDEIPMSMPVKTADVSDLTDIKVLNTFSSGTGATPHNPFMFDGDKLVVAYYLDGVQVFDVKDPQNPVRIAYFDTYPENDNRYPTDTVYAGCWGAYTDLPSKTIIASDMQHGLFMLNTSAISAVSTPCKKAQEISVFPNPFKDKLVLDMGKLKSARISIKISDLMGRTVLQELFAVQTSIEIKLPSDLKGGVYFVSAACEDGTRTFKVIKQ